MERTPKKGGDYQRKPDGSMAVGVADERLCGRAFDKKRRSTDLSSTSGSATCMTFKDWDCFGARRTAINCSQ